MKKLFYVKLCLGIAASAVLLVFVFLYLDYKESQSDLQGAYGAMMDRYTVSTSKDAFRIKYYNELEERSAETDGTTNQLDIELNTDGWYTTVGNTDASTSSTQIVGKFRLYDGLPWDADDTTYIYNQAKAKSEIMSLMESAGVVFSQARNSIINSSLGSGYAIASWPVMDGSAYLTIDGVDCVPICISPAMVDKTYFAEKATKFSTATAITAGTLKIAIIVVPKDTDKEDTSLWKYIPATNADAKAHTWYGGVIQTNVKVVNESTVQISKDWSGQKQFVNFDLGSNYDPIEAIKRVEAEIPKVRKVNFTMGSWGKNDLETYNLSAAAKSALSNFDIVGMVVWGGV